MKLDKKTIMKIIGIITFAIVLFCALQNLSAVFEGIETVFSYFSAFVAGGAIAFVINVPMRAVESVLFPKCRKLDKLRRPAALILTLLLILAVVALVCIAVIPQLIETIAELASTIPAYASKIYVLVEKWLKDYPDLLEQFEKWVRDIDWNGILSSVSNWLSTGLSSTITVAGSAINGIVSAVVGFVFAIYLLLQKERFGRQAKMIIYAVLPEKAADKTLEISNMSTETFSKFISGQCLEACILGCLFAIAMSIFGMPYVALISVLIAFMALIPIVGAFIGCAVGAFLIFMTDPMQALWFVIMFLIIQQIEGNLIYPKVVGNSVGLPAIWVLAVVTIGGKLMGVTGMLLMIPLSSVCYALFREFVYNRIKGKNERIRNMFLKGPVPEEGTVIADEPNPAEETQPNDKEQPAVKGKRNTNQ